MNIIWLNYYKVHREGIERVLAEISELRRLKPV